MVTRREQQEGLFDVNTVWAAVENTLSSVYIKPNQWTPQELGLPKHIPEIEKLSAQGELIISSRKKFLVEGSAATVTMMKVDGQHQIHVSFASLYPGNPGAGKPADADDARRVKLTHGEAGPFAGSRVMQGWNAALNAHEAGQPSLWQQVASEIKTMQAKDHKAQVIFSGYSLGAPAAQVAAGRWLAGGHDIGGVYAFASPRLGNSSFEKQFERALAARGEAETPAYVFGRHDDILRRMPPLARDGMPGEVYVDPQGVAKFSPSHFQAVNDFLKEYSRGGMDSFKNGHRPAGYLKILSDMSTNSQLHKTELDNLHKARDVMAEIEKTPQLSPQALEKKWQAAADFISRAGIEIQATDTKTKPFKNPQNEAHKVRDEIEMLYNRILAGDTRAVAQLNRSVQKDMEAGFRATVLDRASSPKVPEHE